MNTRLKALLSPTPAQIAKLILLLLNVISFIFGLVYALTHAYSAAADAFTVILLITVFFDLFYTAFSKSRMSLILMLFLLVMFLISYLATPAASLTHSYRSVSAGGLIALVSMPFAAAVALCLDALGFAKTGFDASVTKSVVCALVTLAAPVGLFAFALLAYDAVYNFGYSLHEYTTSVLDQLYLFLAVFLAAFFIRAAFTEQSGSLGYKFKKNGVLLTVTLMLAGFTFGSFIKTNASVAVDTAAADAYLTRLAGGAAQRNTLEKDGFRSTTFSLADMYFGIPTNGYAVERDVVYYEEGADSTAFRLRYDVYYPTDSNAHRAVLVSMHGRSGDKGNNNHPQRMKYFAGLGYVVYDIQVGDFNEFDTNFSGERPGHAEMLPNIAAFFAYAAAHNNHGADFGAVFLSGSSMGGSLTFKYALTYENGLAALGITLKGIVPIYPGYDIYSDDPIENYIAAIDENTVPCLLYMGSHDGNVLSDAYFYVAEAYDNAENDGFLGVYASYIGHSGDAFFTGRGNQLLIYYMERFMEALRSPI